jgi:hypothetical protein
MRSCMRGCIIRSFPLPRRVKIGLSLGERMAKRIVAGSSNRSLLRRRCARFA